METKSPEEVLRAVAKDLKFKGLTHEAAAKQLGYTNKQTLSNLLSQKKYLSGIQALKFHEAFNYNQTFLMSGEGELNNDQTLRYESYMEMSPRDYLVGMATDIKAGGTGVKPENDLMILRSYFRRIIEAWGHPIAKNVLAAYQMYESCADIVTLMAFMAEVEKGLQVLENEKKTASTETGK